MKGTSITGKKPGRKTVGSRMAKRPTIADNDIVIIDLDKDGGKKLSLNARDNNDNVSRANSSTTPGTTSATAGGSDHDHDGGPPICKITNVVSNSPPTASSGGGVRIGMVSQPKPLPQPITKPAPQLMRSTKDQMLHMFATFPHLKMENQQLKKETVIQRKYLYEVLRKNKEHEETIASMQNKIANQEKTATAVAKKQGSSMELSQSTAALITLRGELKKTLELMDEDVSEEGNLANASASDEKMMQLEAHLKKVAGGSMGGGSADLKKDVKKLEQEFMQMSAEREKQDARIKEGIKRTYDAVEKVRKNLNKEVEEIPEKPQKEKENVLDWLGVNSDTIQPMAVVETAKRTKKTMASSSSVPLTLTTRSASQSQSQDAMMYKAMVKPNYKKLVTDLPGLSFKTRQSRY